MLNEHDVLRLTAKYDLGRVPGYLSYPAVTHWDQPISPEDVVEICARPQATDDAYLYFHFPYCETLCYYCACYMKVTANPKQRYDEYLDALEKELALKCARRGQAIGAGEMHWGGGTPTYMSCAQIERAFGIIARHVRWKPGATLSIEAYPDERTLSDEKLALLRSLGFSQISFGIESLDPKVLATINRRHELRSIRHWTDAARALGFGVHVDVVYGLPYQNPANLQATLESLMTIAPDRIAAFAFMYTPSMIKHQRAIPPASVPSSAERVRLYQTLPVIEDYGYTRVGCDHWVSGSTDPLLAAAANGEIIYHFQGYEPATREHFLGFGSSAISFVSDRYFQNATGLGEYVAALDSGTLPVQQAASRTLDRTDRVRHYIIMKSIMSDLRIDKADLQRRFGIAFDEHFGPEIAELKDMEADGLVAGVDGDEVRVTDDGLAFIRNIARVFDAYRLPDFQVPALPSTLRVVSA